jgi:hypothetical protein
MSDLDLKGRWKANKWTIFLLTCGLALNLGLTQVGKRRIITWHEVNTVRTWKEVVFSILVGQSGKAVRKWQEREGGGPNDEGGGEGPRD